MSVLSLVVGAWLAVLVLVVASVALEVWADRETKGGQG